MDDAAPSRAAEAMAVQLITLPPGVATVAVMRIFARLDAAERQLSAARAIVAGLVEAAQGATAGDWNECALNPNIAEVENCHGQSIVIGCKEADAALIAATRNAIAPLARALGMEDDRG